MINRKKVRAPKSLGRRTLLRTAGVGMVLSPFTNLFAQAYRAPGVYVEELGSVPPTIQIAGMSVGLFVDRFSNDVEVAVAHDCRNEADLFRLIGKNGSLLFPEAYATARQFFAHGGQQLFIINTPLKGEMPDWSTVFSNVAVLPEANLVYLPTAASAFGTNLVDLGALYRDVITWCGDNYAMLLIDGPDAVSNASSWRTDLAIDSVHAAAYAPSLKDAGCERLALGIGGAAAGVIAAFEQRHGVWKAPAGIEASLVGLLPNAAVSNAEKTALSALNINPILTLDRSGARSHALWGARTMSNDATQRYLNVHRLGLMIEKSVYAGLDWVTLEPNDESLWANVETSVSNFLTTLYRNGAFRGRSQSEAFFVKCGFGETMTQNDLDNGRLVCEIGFAPLKPAEFVVSRFEWDGLTS